MTSKNILNIGSLAIRDDSIIRKEFYQYSPYTTTFGNSDEIRIAIQSQDSYLLPCESYIYMLITATTEGANVPTDAEVNFVTNFASFLFSDVRYELNGVEIDRLRNVGRASTMKLLTASRTSQLNGFHYFCNSMSASSPRSVAVGNAAIPPKYFDIVIPLSVWFGFCDDYRKLILNCKHELILNRSRSTLNCVSGGGEAETAARVTLTLNKIQWKMPHITLSDGVKLKMLNYLSKNRKITIQHRSADLVEYPELPQATHNMWVVKSVSHVHRPRYVVVGLQTNRENLHIPNASRFDNCNVSDVRLHINSQIYPYNINEVNLNAGKYAELYDMYTRIQGSYYNDTEGPNLFCITYGTYQSTPLFAFDTSRADESLIDSTVDIKVEIKTSVNMPAGTAAFCLIIYDNEFTYSPFDGLVVRNTGMRDI